jgi:hypothetical protein
LFLFIFVPWKLTPCFWITDYIHLIKSIAVSLSSNDFFSTIFITKTQIRYILSHLYFHVKFL